MTVFKSLKSIRDDMVGCTYQGRNGDEATVVNVVGAGGGYQVHFNYGAPHNVFCALGRFRKRYPFKINYPVSVQ